MALDLVSSTRRRVLGRLLRLRTGRRQLTDDSLLSLLPESALVPLQRDRLDPVEDLGRIREREPVSRLLKPRRPLQQDLQSEVHRAPALEQPYCAVQVDLAGRPVGLPCLHHCL